MYQIKAKFSLLLLIQSECLPFLKAINAVEPNFSARPSQKNREERP
jgi:hypothetical protein